MIGHYGWGRGTPARERSGPAAVVRPNAGRQSDTVVSSSRQRGTSKLTTRWLVGRAAGIAIALCALLLTLPTPGASAGVYQVANCGADRVNYTTRAFNHLAHRGMLIRRACNPTGSGMRGLITSNVVRGGTVPRASLALLTLSAPAGTTMTKAHWAGWTYRQDCRYSIQLWADAPGTKFKRVWLENRVANKKCNGPKRLRLGSDRAKVLGLKPFTTDVRGATRIVQRVVCVAQKDRPKSTCSADSTNYLRTDMASVDIEDKLPPGVAILADTPLARGEWAGGQQPLNYAASDNVGVRRARARIGERDLGSEERPCVLAAPAGGPYATQVPCPNGAGVIKVQTERHLEGTQTLAVQAEDTAGNVADSAPVTARIDNTPPARVDVGVEGGDAWRNRNDWAAVWRNPDELDRAPIVGANYHLCAAGGESCIDGSVDGPHLSRLPVAVPGPGEWTVALWRRDAAGNGEADNASVPVTLRYDPDPPALAFEPSAASDPTLVAVQVDDQVSGLADGSIEISRAGSGIWQTLATQKEGTRLLARIDDATLPPGPYVLRARAHDQARNEGSSDLRVDGQPMQVTLPLRIVAAMAAGIERTRIVTHVIRRRGKRREVHSPVRELVPVARVEFGHQVRIVGRLAGTDGRGIGDAQVRVVSFTQPGTEQQVGNVRTGPDGGFEYVTSGSTSRTLVLVYEGSLVTLPVHSQLEMRVPAATSARVSRRRVLNGQAVEFTGRLQGLPVPSLGKLVEVQVKLSGHWQTFRTTRSDADGRWASRYRFRRTRGVQRYRFRVRLPKEAGYPFETGVSRALVVRVTGQ